MSAEKDMTKALLADGEKLLALTGQDHGPFHICESCHGEGVVGGLTREGYDIRRCDDCDGTGFESIAVTKATGAA